ncbi:MAG: hypothetical protein QF619_04965 [Candidatus Binatia bacterium]|nr:hypothetical protein [Candidatus Binatia bacterium]
MNETTKYIVSLANFFKIKLGVTLVEVYKLGSLAHGGFSHIYSDLDVGLLLNCPNPPEGMAGLISEAKELDLTYGRKLSVFWGNPEHEWGRLPVLDRIDLLDHGVPLLNNHKPIFKRPDTNDIHQALLQSIEKSWKPRITELAQLTELEAKDRKPYVRCLLYPARMIYSWDCLKIDSNDKAVEYLHEVKPSGLDLHPIKLALECRYDRYTPEKIISERIDLNKQFETTISYISNSKYSGVYK